MTNEQLDIKFDYERRFNKLFFSKDFKQKMIEKHHYCPQGLTFDVDFNDNNEIEFYACCKKYNYDFSDSIVDGDYMLLKTPIKDEWVTFMNHYIHDNDEWLTEKLKGKLIYY
jgi:hypothetical protein